MCRRDTSSDSYTFKTAMNCHWNPELDAFRNVKPVNWEAARHREDPSVRVRVRTFAMADQHRAFSRVEDTCRSAEISTPLKALSLGVGATANEPIFTVRLGIFGVLCQSMKLPFYLSSDLTG